MSSEQTSHGPEITAGEKLPPHPFCNVCGWRKGGVDSWDGVACKCGHSEPPIHAVHCATRSGGYIAGRCNCSTAKAEGC